MYKDLLPVPGQDPRQEEDKTTTLTDVPTKSHALAMEAAKAPEERGAAQVEHEEEVVNLGWNEPESHIESPLVGGLSNEDLWVLIRRFNKVRCAPACTVMSLIDSLANVPCQRDPESTSRWFGSEHRRRGGVFSRQA